MGEVVPFRAKKLTGFIPEEPRRINLAEPITADQFPPWNSDTDTAPSEHWATDGDPA